MQYEKHHILGIDIGGTGIKGAVVDTQTKQLVTERIRLLTPQPATPANMVATVKLLVDQLNWTGTIGCGFPTLVKDGVCCAATNIDDSWIGQSVDKLIEAATGCPVVVLNDADAAAWAILHCEPNLNHQAVNLVLTIGTGIGSGVFNNGQLLPNTEFGHLLFKGDIAERYCSNAARKRHDLSWDVWGKRLNEYLLYVQKIVNPDCIILGGGVSKKFHKYEQYITLDIPVIPSALRNEAGTLGAALWAAQ